MTTKRYVSIEEAELADLRSRVISAEQMHYSATQLVDNLQMLCDIKDGRIKRLTELYARQISNMKKKAELGDALLTGYNGSVFCTSDDPHIRIGYDTNKHAEEAIEALADAWDSMQKDQSNGI